MEPTDLFKKVQKVEAPPFLLTRIQARLNALETLPAPASWQFVGATVLVLLLWLNFNTLQSGNNTTPGSGQTNTMVGAMQLDTNPHLYAD